MSLPTLTIDHTESPSEDILRLSGVLDLPASHELRTAISELLQAERHRVLVDLSGLRLLDCASVGTLLETHAIAEKAGGYVRAPGASGIVLTVLEITGAAKKLRAYDAVADQPVRAETGPPHHHSWTTVNELLRQLRTMPPGTPFRDALRRRVIEDTLPLAEKLARRFTGLGESPADLTQVAALGLVKAIDGFDPEYGTDFGGYATPTIVGELKRHFRDKGWGVHVPRRLQELRLDLNRARDELTQRLGRSPTTSDIAEYLEIDEERVIEAVVASSAYRPTSIDTPLGTDEGGATLADVLGGDDADIDLVEMRASLQPMLASLPERERKILSLRFYGNKTQSEIASIMGISQMHVSRLLTRTLARLRRHVLAEG